ncbi:uncharacterized protein LOC122500771 [Leptopilina heterotoma]|uniref:uncharacterized protein LOC122500771 n=1 Tax=Leptopilina heterotoma TaxID=63436 RepID=UPI001CA98B0C|nr:uncharacterized protein LOC122500771 [Leptopilina heterotoma]
MKLYFEKIKRAIMPILIVNWLIGLGPVQYPIGNSRGQFSFIFVLLIASCYLFVSYTELLGSCSDTNVHSFDYLVFSVNRYLNTFTAITSLIIGWLNRKKLQLIWERITLIDETFKLFGLKRNYYSIFVESLLASILWAFGFLTMYTMDILGHLDDWTLHRSLYCVFRFHWAIHTNTVVDISFAVALSCLNDKLRKINNILQIDADLTKLQLPNTIKRTNKISSVLNKDNLSKKNLIEILKHLHLEVCEMTREISEIYQVHIALEMITNFSSLTAVLYYFLNSMSELENFLVSDKKIAIIGLIGWSLIFFSRFLYINVVAEKIYSEAIKTGYVVLNLKSENENETLENEIEQFTLQLTQQPLCISMYGLNDLGHDFIKNV